MSIDSYAIIMAGGKGERFWPMSTAKNPKQFLSLVGDKPLLTQAIDRLKGLMPSDHIYVITNADLADRAIEIASDLPPENIIGEPVGRDTAAAIALGTAIIKQRNPAAVCAILTADHIIRDLPIFQQTLQDGFELASKNPVLITIGIQPASPSTGYGYLEASEVESSTEQGTVFLKAKRFVEKPDLKTAEEYLKTGNFFWNSGMFIWSVETITKAFENYCTPLYNMIDELVAKDDILSDLNVIYEKLDKISIDYAVMEKSENVITARGTFYWDDVGSWTALNNHFEKDAESNIVIGKSQAIDSKGNIIISQDHLTAVIGMDDVIVIQAEGVTLICPKAREQEIKQLVGKIRESKNYEELL